MKKIFTLSILFTIPFVTSAASFIEYPDLKYGVTDSHVTEIQKFLNTNNYIVNPIEGEPGSLGYEGTYFGKLTQKALSLFQKDNNITPALGYFGLKTKAQMDIMLQSPEQADLSVAGMPLARTQTYTVNYKVPATGYGCKNKTYTPTIAGRTTNTIGPFSYPVKMTFEGFVDDNLMINGIIVDAEYAKNGDPCSHSHNLTYTKEFPAGTPIRFNVVDNYGGSAELSGKITITPTTVQSQTVKLTTTATNGKISQPNTTGVYTKDQTTTLKAIPNKGYEFSNWTGACTGKNVWCNLKMDQNKSVQAVFIKKQVAKVTLNIEGPGKIQASIARNGNPFAKPQEFTQTKKTLEFDNSADLKLTAVADDGARVVGWTDERCEKTASTTIDVKYLTCKEKTLFVRSYIPGDANITVNAKFEKVKPKAQCNVIAYGGYGSDGTGENKIKEIVDIFNKNKDKKVKTQVTSFYLPGKVGGDANKRLALIPKSEKVLFVTHSISGIGLWNAIKEGEISRDFSYLLYDPPYHAANIAPDFWTEWFAWVPWGGEIPADIRKAQKSGIEYSEQTINWTCGYTYDSYTDSKCKFRTLYKTDATKKRK